MQYLKTIEGYPVLLATRTRNRFFSEADLLNGNRKTPWVYLCQNLMGRWLVLIPHPSEPKEFYCVAGAKRVQAVLKAFIQQAVDFGILKRDTRQFSNVVRDLGFYAQYR